MHTNGDDLGRQQAPSEPRHQRHPKAGRHQDDVRCELVRLVHDVGKAAGAVVHAGQPLTTDGVLWRRNPRLVSQIDRRDDISTGEGVSPGDEDVGHIARQVNGVYVIGNRQRHVAPAVYQSDIAATGSDEVDCVPRIAFEQANLETRMLVEDHGKRIGQQPPNRSGEGDQTDGARHRPGLLMERCLDLLEVAEQSCAAVDELSTLPGEHHAATDALEQGDTGLTFETLDLLGDGTRREPQAGGGGNHRTFEVDGPQGGKRMQIDHEGTLHGWAKIKSLVLHDRMDHPASVNRRDTCLAALVVTIWGFNFVVIGWGMTGVPPLLFAAVRFTVVLAPAVFLIPKPDAPWRTILGVGTFMSLGQFGFLYSSMHAGMPPGIAALVLQVQVLLTVLIAAGVLRERPSRSQLGGVALGSLGLFAVALGRGGQISIWALVLCLCAGLCWAVGNVISRASGIRGGLALTVWSALVVPLPLFGLSLLLDGPSAVGAALTDPSWKSVVSTLYTACLASLFGYGVFNGLLSRYPSSAVVPWALAGPVVAMFAAWLLLDQRPNVAEAGGGLLLVCGALVALRPQPQGARSQGARSASWASRISGVWPWMSRKTASRASR